MNKQQTIDLITELLFATGELALPLLLTALVVGLVISVFQAATQINESTLSFLPKIAAMMAVLIMISPWMIRRLTTYTSNLYLRIPALVKNK